MKRRKSKTTRSSSPSQTTSNLRGELEKILLKNEAVNDRDKVKLLSDYISMHRNNADMSIAIYSLGKLHSKICRRFRKAIIQINLLNNKIQITGSRYKSASETNRRSSRYVLRMRLAVLEGVRTCFSEYAQEKADTLKDIERLFLREQTNGFDVATALRSDARN